MSPFQDHIIAAVAAAGILLTTSNLQHQRAFDVLNQTRLQGGQAALDAFADVVAQDLRSMGSGVPTGESMILEATSHSLTFRGTSDETPTARTLRYSWTDEPETDGRMTVRVVREVDGAVQGQSPALASFSLALLDDLGGAVGPSELEDARRVHVAAALSMPADAVSEDAPVRGLSWETGFTPPNLARRTTRTEPHPLLTANVSLETFGD